MNNENLNTDEARAKLFASPVISDWIHKIQISPMMVRFVPERNKSPEVFRAAVIDPPSKDMIAYFDKPLAIRTLRELYRNNRETFPDLFSSLSHALNYYSTRRAEDAGTAKSERLYYFYAAEAILLETPPEETATHVDDKITAVGFKQIYGDHAAMKLLSSKYKRYVAEDGLGM